MSLIVRGVHLFQLKIRFFAKERKVHIFRNVQLLHALFFKSVLYLYIRYLFQLLISDCHDDFTFTKRNCDLFCAIFKMLLYKSILPEVSNKGVS